MARVLIAGCGYIGHEIAGRLVAQGDQVFALNRRPRELPSGVVQVLADLTGLNTLNQLPPGLDQVVYCAAANQRETTAYHQVYVQGPRNLLAALRSQGQSPQRIVFTSSTSVYGQQNGEWVDENSSAEPWLSNGRLLLEGEATFREGSIPAIVVRLAGIYGPGRSRFIQRVREGQPVAADAAQRFTNRIHRDDCAGAIVHLLKHPSPKRLYLGVDCAPCTELEVLEWLARRLKVALPPMDLRGCLQAERGSNKRCGNARLLASGYQFSYPTYREGLAALLAPELV
jgi:nucleoside-diphosphate-sugar epimerase